MHPGAFRSADAVHRIVALAEELGGALAALDVATLAGGDARDLVAVLARLERRAAAASVRCGARAAAPTMRREGGEREAGEWFAHSTGRTRRQAEAALHLAQVAHEAPATARAWAEGELTVELADQITEAVRCAPDREGDLLALARRAPAEELRREARKIVRDARDETIDEREARHHRRRRLGTWTTDDGAFEGRFATAPSHAVGIATALELCAEAAFRRARREHRREPLAAHRLDGLALMAHLATGGHPAHLGYQLVDLPAIRRGHTLPGERCEIPGIGPVPVTYARELLGEGLLRLAIRDGIDVRTVVHPRRRPNAHQMTALLARYDECAVSGCTTRAALQTDHDHPWAATHQTWLPNLKKVCPHHHARKTNHGWDWVIEEPDPLTGKHRLVAPGHPDPPPTTGATKPTPRAPARGEPPTSRGPAGAGPSRSGGAPP
jgi:hypothetical protein